MVLTSLTTHIGVKPTNMTQKNKSVGSKLRKTVNPRYLMCERDNIHFEVKPFEVPHSRLPLESSKIKILQDNFNSEFNRVFSATKFIFKR